MENQNKFYWIKLRTDFFNQDTIDFLMSQENGSDYVVLYQMLCLNTANTDGRLINEIGEVIVPYNIEKIARDTKYFNVDTVLVALELYKKIGLVYVEDDGNLRITDIERMVGSESASRDAIKKRNQRLKKKIIEGTQKGTNCLIENRDKRLDIRDKNIYINNIYDDDDIYTYYQNNIGVLTNRQYEIINSYLDYFNEDILKEAINRASDNNGKTFKYVESILKSWKQKGYKTLIEIKEEKKSTNTEESYLRVLERQWKEEGIIDE